MKKANTGIVFMNREQQPLDDEDYNLEEEDDEDDDDYLDDENENDTEGEDDYSQHRDDSSDNDDSEYDDKDADKEESESLEEFVEDELPLNNDDGPDGNHGTIGGADATKLQMRRMKLKMITNTVKPQEWILKLQEWMPHYMRLCMTRTQMNLRIQTWKMKQNTNYVAIGLDHTVT